jgi:hypothetical protein
LNDFEFGDSTPYLPVPEGSHLVEIFPDGSDDAAISANIDLVQAKAYTAIAVGDITNQDLELILEEDDLSSPAEGSFKLRLGHLAPFAADLQDTLADIRLENGTPVLLNVPYGGVSPDLELPAGRYDLKITTPGGETTLINPLPVDLQAGTILSAFAVGESVEQPLGVFALPAGQEGFLLPLGETAYTLYLPLILQDGRQVSLRVAHASPDAPAVDVWLNGSIAISGLAFGETSDYSNLPPGQYEVAVTPAGETSPRVIEATLTLTGGMKYTVAAVGALADIEPLVLADESSTPAAGMAHVRFVHLSPDAPAVDVALAGGDVLFGNVAFKEASDYLPVPASSYNLEVRLAGTNTVVLPLPGVVLEEGTVYTVFAMGLAGGNPALQAVIVIDL